MRLTAISQVGGSFQLTLVYHPSMFFLGIDVAPQSFS